MTTLFFVHGLWATPRIWENYQDYFSNLGYRVICPALPQHFSKNQAQHPAQLSLQNYVDQLEEDYRLVAEESNHIVIVGHGAGCVLSQQLAMRTEPDALILLAPEAAAGLGNAFPTTRALKDICATPLFWQKGVKPSFKSTREYLFNTMTEKQAQAAYSQMCFESGLALKELWFWYLDTKNRSEIEREKIDCPIMTLAGAKDRYSSARTARRISRHLGQGRHFHRLQKFGHMIPLEDTHFEVAKQMHVWLCWQLGMQSQTNKAV